ncbi:MAG: nitrate reductase [Deferrisomatales bacterium]
MGAFAVLAESFRYPAPGRLESLRSAVSRLPPGTVRDRLEDFLSDVGSRSLEEWEELSTRTLDLELASAPYLGFQVWGDKYQRSPFLAELGVAMDRAGIDRDGELPDHVVPVLRFLDACDAPPERLLEVLGPALESLEKALRSSDPDNPYLHLIAGARRQAEERPAAAVAGSGAVDGERRSP